MSDLGNLQKRVGNAVEMLRQSESQRRQHNDSLGRLLNDLETKFEARTLELDHCRSRIAQLEESNRVLTGLVGELVDIVERTADHVAEDPIYRTTAEASDIVTRYVPDVPANDPREASARVEQAGAPTAIVRAFEDVGADDLLAEDLYEKSAGAASYPRLVHDAAALARGEEIAPVPTAPVAVASASDDGDAIGIPEPVRKVAAAAAEPEGDLDIKQIMERLEMAAERAQFRADQEERHAAAAQEFDRAIRA